MNLPHMPPPQPPGTGAGTAVEELSAAQAARENQWRTVVWNDPVNLMSYVVYVFRTYFGYSTAVAEQLTTAVHEHGRAVVSRGSRESSERDVLAMHRYGLRATIERDEDL